jgi:hypothetical protein
MGARSEGFTRMVVDGFSAPNPSSRPKEKHNPKQRASEVYEFIEDPH